MLNSYCKQLLNSIAAAAELCLPKYRHSGHSPSSLSGWNNASLSLKQSARLWHKVWTECGCSTTGVLFQIKKNSKRRFKYEVRRRQCHIKREKLANAFSHSSSRDFWKEVKKISKSTKGSHPNSTANIVDGSCDNCEIANILSSKLKSILNSSSDSQSSRSLLERISNSVSSSDLSLMSISQETVCDAFAQLKPGKHDGSSLMSNHFIHAKTALSDPLSKLFTAMLRHGVVPESLRDCILVPIPKPGKDPSSSDNYRPIALAPTLSKIFEWCILLEFQSCFVTSSLQFGFKPGFSADLCTGLLKNVIHTYMVNDSQVYGCFLDASKAFDRVNYVLLFEKLLQRNLPPAIVRLLLSWYSSQQLKVRWCNDLSDPFSTSNGVRQGGVLSPILFTIYIDDLLTTLENNGVGCFWKHHYVGAVCYADDVALLAPSPFALRNMLDTCSKFADQHHLCFNADKTQLIKFSKTSHPVNSTPRFIFLGKPLSVSRSIKHLGHILTSNLSKEEDITAISKDMCRKANHLLHIFSCCDPSVKTHLFSSFCLSLYGAALWRVSCPQLRALEVSFNNVLRKIWSLPRHSHTGIVQSVAGLQSIYNTVLYRSRKLIASAKTSICSLISDIFSESAATAFTSFGYNLLCGNKYRKLYSDDDLLCANFVRDARMNPAMNRHLNSDIYDISTL